MSYEYHICQRINKVRGCIILSKMGVDSVDYLLLTPLC